jgi:hypothetical protein
MADAITISSFAASNDLVDCCYGTRLVNEDIDSYSQDDPLPEKLKVKITTRIKASDIIYFPVLPPDNSYKPQLNSRQRFPLSNTAFCCSYFAVSRLRGPPVSALS